MKEKNLKLKEWTKGNVYSVIATYIINVLIFSLLFIGICAVNAYSEEKPLFDMLANSGETVIDFAIIISLIL
ncbi:MAG: hypothetical protein IJQ66_04515, partial [Clostridia bacterium]|nr:hypothetical protein [Clostridia bacterium]